MANVKISELPSLSTMTDAAEIPVVASGTTQQITGANLKAYFTANVGFTGNTIYDLNGLNVNNSDLSHGFTAGITVPSNGNTTAPFQLTNTYGNITIGTGPSSTVTSTWTFDENGVLGLPGGANITDGNLNAGSASATVSLNAFAPDGNTVSIQAQGNTSAAVISVFANSGPTTNTWQFNSTGTMVFPNGANIRTIDELTIINSTATANGIIGVNARESATGESVAQIYLDSTDRVVRFGTYNPDTEIGYDWTFDAGGSFTLPTAPGNVYFGTNTNGPVILADSLGITLNANRADTAQEYVTVSQDGVNIFSVNTINIENNTTGLLNSDINLRSGDDILLQGRDKSDDTEAEGGDINIWAGDGAASTGIGNDTGGGGDIQILSGWGGSGTGTGVGAASGGFITITAGDGGTSVDSNAGGGGSVTISAGSGPSGADPSLGGIGGSVNITAGSTARVNENGGSIELTTGSSTGLGTGGAGYVAINIPSSNIGPGGNWYFTGTGTSLEVPADSSIFGPNFGNFTVGCAGNTIVTSSDYGANVKNWVFGYTGTLTLPGNGTIYDNNGFTTTTGTNGVELVASGVDSGATVGVEDTISSYMLAGNATAASNIVVSLSNIAAQSSGNISLTSNEYTWNFDTTGTLTVPFEGLIQSLNDTIILRSKDTGTGNRYDARLGTNGGLYFETTEYPQGWLNIVNNEGNANINAIPGTAGAGGKSIYINAGAADQTDFYTTPGGSVNITGGLGASNDGGGGGPGGNVNITAGISSDPAGHAGNVKITSGSNNWVFDYTGNLTASGNVTVSGTGGISIPNLPAFRVTGSGNTVNLGNTINSTGNLTINNFTVDYNQGSYLNTATGVFTAPVAGLYSVDLVARTSSQNDGTSQIAVVKNGSAQQCFWEVSASSTVGHMGVSTTSKLDVGDTLTCKVLLGNVNFDSNDSYSVAFLG